MHEGHHCSCAIFFLCCLVCCSSFAVATPRTPILADTTAEEIANAKPKPVAAAAPKGIQQSAANTNGAQLYAQNCAICHSEGKNGPPLEGIMNRREFPSGTPVNDARLKDTIKMGRAMMPAFSNTPHGRTSRRDREVRPHVVILIFFIPAPSVAKRRNPPPHNRHLAWVFPKKSVQSVSSV